MKRLQLWLETGSEEEVLKKMEPCWKLFECKTELKHTVLRKREHCCRPGSGAAPLRGDWQRFGKRALHKDLNAGLSSPPIEMTVGRNCMPRWNQLLWFLFVTLRFQVPKVLSLPHLLLPLSPGGCLSSKALVCTAQNTDSWNNKQMNNPPVAGQAKFCGFLPWEHCLLSLFLCTFSPKCSQIRWL